MIKAIFFDMGGVLMPLDLERCIEAYRNVAGFKDIDDFLDPCHQRGFFLDLEDGSLSLDDFINECLKHSSPGATRETIMECHRFFFDPPSPETVELINELGKRYDLFILSNNNPLSMSILRPLFANAGIPFDSCFKKLFVSSEMHLLKPGPEIFLRAIEESGYDKSEILYIDDSISNVEGGRAVGLKSALYVPGTSLKALIDANLD